MPTSQFAVFASSVIVNRRFTYKRITVTKFVTSFFFCLFLVGKLAISAHQDNFTDILESTQILVDGGLHIGFLKDDYSFEIRNVVPGSYLVQVGATSVFCFFVFALVSCGSNLTIFIAPL